MKQTLWLNLYRSGVYHRQGKPGTTNIHGGDLYAAVEKAMEQAEPDKGYITTVPVEVHFAAPVFVNPDDSVPTPLSATLRQGASLLPYLQLAEAPSLETAEGDTEVSYEQWRDSRRASGFEPAPAAAYKPAHGGYPS